MTEHAGYGQFCPVAMAAEILCARWTVLIVRELICGTTRSTIFAAGCLACRQRFCRSG
jgi:DNA-binding HxlR family transcriptional regulator